MGFDAVELNEHATTKIIRSPPQFVYNGGFEGHSGVLHQCVSLIICMNIYVLYMRNNLTVQALLLLVGSNVNLT